MHVDHINFFEDSVQRMSEALVDFRYNPFTALSDDEAYFGDHSTAQYLSGIWLQGRAKRIVAEEAHKFYCFLVSIRNQIEL